MKSLTAAFTLCRKELAIADDGVAATAAGDGGVTAAQSDTTRLFALPLYTARPPESCGRINPSVLHVPLALSCHPASLIASKAMISLSICRCTDRQKWLRSRMEPADSSMPQRVPFLAVPILRIMRVYLSISKNLRYIAIFCQPLLRGYSLPRQAPVAACFAYPQVLACASTIAF